MAASGYWYGLAMKAAINKEWDWDSDTIRCGLATSDYSVNQDTDDYWNDVSGNEVSGTGYTAGGASMASVGASYDGGTNILKLDAADVTWATSTISARYAVVYCDTGTASTSALICYQDFGATEESSAGNFTIQWNANGIAKITVS